MQGIIKTRYNKAKAPYNIVGKSLLLEFTANVLSGNNIDHYDLDILNPTNNHHFSNNQSRTNSAYRYELRSNNDLAVSIDIREHANARNLFSTFASSTALDWSTLTVFRKTSSIPDEDLPDLPDSLLLLTFLRSCFICVVREVMALTTIF